MRSSAITWLALLRALAPTLAIADANPLPALEDKPRFYFPRVVKRQIFTNTTTSETTSELERVPLTVTPTTTNDLESFFSALNSGDSSSAVTTSDLILPNTSISPAPTPVILLPALSSTEDITLSTSAAIGDATSSAPFTPGVVPGFTPGVIPTSTTDITSSAKHVPSHAPDTDSPTISSSNDLPTLPLTIPLVSDTSLPAVPLITDLPTVPSLLLGTGPSAPSTTDLTTAPVVVPLVSGTGLPVVPLSTDLSTAPIIVPLVSDTVAPTITAQPAPESSTDVLAPLLGSPPDTSLLSALLSTQALVTDISVVPTVSPTIDTALVPAVTDPAVSTTEPVGVTAGIAGPATGPDATITPTPTVFANETVPASPLDTTQAGDTTIDVSPGISSAARQTIMPTGTDSATSQWLPPVIVVQTDAPSTLADASTTQTGIPSGLPKAIAPNGGVPTEPKNTTMIQIAFIYKLSYPFVVSSSITAAQIFTFLPLGLSYDLGIPEDQVTMRTLEPYDTTKDLGYVTTLALAYIPVDLVDQLSLDLHTPHSDLYKNPDDAVACLMNLINPSFPILAGQGIAGDPSGIAAGNPQATSGAGSGSVFGGENQNSGPVDIKTVGFGICATIGGIAYVAAVFFVARRYKQRRQRHQRSSSLLSVIGEREGLRSGPLMGGGLASGDRETPGGRATPGNGRESRGSRGSGGNSARTQNISAPVMAENSLGWS